MPTTGVRVSDHDREGVSIASVSAFRVRPFANSRARDTCMLALVGQLFATYCRRWRKGATLFRQSIIDGLGTSGVMPKTGVEVGNTADCPMPAACKL